MLTLPGPELNQDRNLKAGTNAEAMTLAPYGLFSLLSYRTKDHQARNGTTHNRLGTLTSIANLKKKMSQSLGLMESSSQLRYPPFR